MSASTTTSGTEAGFDLPGYYAVDGSDSTRWSSQKAPSASTPAWIALDLGQTRSIAGISVHWEAAPSGTWQIQSSADGNTWTAVDAAIAQPSGNGVTSTFSTAFTTRYVRILATGTQGTAGLSIYEITITGASRSLALPSTGE